jgi:hypothetical protein
VKVMGYIEGPQIEKIGPLKLPDERVLVWELKRPYIFPLPEREENASREWIMNELKGVLQEKDWTQFHPLLGGLSISVLADLYDSVQKDLFRRNGYVVEFNKTITSLTGSNTAALLLGNAVQSKSALFYLSDYLAKDKVAFGQVLTTLETAKRNIEQYPIVLQKIQELQFEQFDTG